MALMRKLDPPADSASFIECIDWAARRDPIGHRVHFAFAIAALALIPLSSSLATIGSTVLLAYAALRFPTLRHTWRGLPRNPCLLFVVALFAWLCITLLWSPDSEHGLRLLRGSRYILLVPALVPLMRHARLLLFAICAGVFLQNAVQFLQYASTGEPPLGGLDGHPGNTGLWFTLAIGILLTLPGPNTARTNMRRVSAIVPSLGILVTAARSVMLGAVAGILVVFVHAARRPFQGRRQVYIGGVILFVVLAIPSLDSNSAIGSRIRAAWTAMTTTVEEGAANPRTVEQDQTRTIWWRIGMDTWKEHPVAGAGLGSAGRDIRKDPHVQEISSGGTKNLTLLRDDYHSLFVSVAAQGGTIGLALLAAWLILIGRQVLGSGSLTSALLMGFIAYLVFSFFNTTIFTGRVLAFAAVLMAFSTYRLPEQVSLRTATAPPPDAHDDHE
jgi:O-antigen ligase